MLNWYYNMTNHSEVYHIAMGKFLVCIHMLIFCIVLHPCHKLTYFKNEGWELEWIRTAEKIVHNEFEHSYASQFSSGQEEEAVVSELLDFPEVFFFYWLIMSHEPCQ